MPSPTVNGTTVSLTPRARAARQPIRSTRDTRFVRCYAYRHSLGAVVVILENSKQTALAAEYGPDDKGMEYPVTELDEQLSAFFR